jgi:outer membrane usher protein
MSRWREVVAVMVVAVLVGVSVYDPQARRPLVKVVPRSSPTVTRAFVEPSSLPSPLLAGGVAPVDVSATVPTPPVPPSSSPSQAPAESILDKVAAPLVPPLVPGKTPRSFVAVFVDDRARGELLVVLDPERGPLADAADLAALGVGIDGALGLVPLASLPPAVRVRFQEEALRLDLWLPAASGERTVVDLGERPERADALDSSPSVFLNYRVEGSRQGPSGYFELGTSFGRLQATTGTQVTADEEVIRGVTQVAYDDAAEMRRFVVGDTLATTDGLGGTTFVGGVQIAREFELDPTFVRTPGLARDGAVTTPSTLEVWVDGRLVRRQMIPAGEFEVKNLPAAEGAGSVRLVLRDALGRERSFGGGIYQSAGLLAKGVDEYGYTLGFRRDNVGVESWDYDAPAFLGAHRLGVSDRLTLGGRLEAAPQLASAGASATFTTPIGLVEAIAAVSATEGEAGGAVSLAWSWLGRQWSAATVVRAVSPRYATLSMTALDDRTLLAASSHLTLPVHRRLRLTLQGEVAESRDTGFRSRLVLGAHLPFGRGWTFGVSAGESSARDRGVELEALATLSFVVGARTSGVASSARNVQLNRTMNHVNDVGYRVATDFSDGVDGQAALQAQWQHGRYDLELSWVDGEARPSVAASGSVVYVGRRLFAAMPLEQSFALVRVPGVRGVRVFLEDREVGRTDGNGEILVANLLPYQRNRLRVEDEDVPIERAIVDFEREVVPPRRGGVIVSFAADRLTLVRGRVSHTYAYGELVVTWKGGSASSPMGRGGEFELVGLPPGEHLAKIRSRGGSCVAKVRVPAEAPSILSLGRLYCRDTTLAANR